MTGPCTSSLAQWSQFCQQLTELMPEGKLKMCSLNQWVWQSIYLPVYLSIYLSVDVCIYLDQLQPEKARLAPEISKSGCWRYIYICILCNYVYIYIYTDGVFLKWVYLKSFMAVFKAMVTWGTPHLNSSGHFGDSGLYERSFQVTSWRQHCNLPPKRYIYIWVNSINSLIWNKAIWGWFPLLTMIPVRRTVRSL